MEEKAHHESVRERLTKLEGSKATVERRTKSTENAIAKALRKSSGKHGDDPALADFREDLFDELRKMIPEAIRQAKKGKPALLRILTRYSR